MLYENASLYNLENQVQLYVAYRFLDIEPAALETPDSLPLPKPNRPIYFNFKKGMVFFNSNLQPNFVSFGWTCCCHPYLYILGLTLNSSAW